MLSVIEYIVLVKSLVGCPYAHAGRSRDGIDCIGVAVVPLNEMGIYPDDAINYTREAFDKTLALEVGKRFDLVEASKRLPGDVLLFWCNRRTRLPQHAAVLVDNEEIVHAYLPLGRVVRGPIGAWANRITHAFRIPSTMLLRS